MERPGWMVGTSIVLLAVAIPFLRRQTRSMQRREGTGLQQQGSVA
jgi:hypothetical protein